MAAPSTDVDLPPTSRRCSTPARELMAQARRRDAAHGARSPSRRRCSSRSRCCAATVRLLHVRQAAGAPRVALPRARRRARHRPPRRRARLPRGAVHAGRGARGRATRTPPSGSPAHGYASTVDYLVAARRARCSTRPACSPTPTPARSPRPSSTRLRAVSPSQGMMIETLAARLGEPGGPHSGAPDKTPERRLATLEAAGRARVPVHHRHPRRHRRDPRRAARRARSRSATSHARHGHVQEVIVQNFLPKPGTAMQRARRRATPTSSSGPSPPPGSCSAPAMHLQAPPNLSEPTTSARSSRPASTTGAASRRSRPTT